MVSLRESLNDGSTILDNHFSALERHVDSRLSSIIDEKYDNTSKVLAENLLQIRREYRIKDSQDDDTLRTDDLQKIVVPNLKDMLIQQSILRREKSQQASPIKPKMPQID